MRCLNVVRHVMWLSVWLFLGCVPREADQQGQSGKNQPLESTSSAVASAKDSSEDEEPSAARAPKPVKDRLSRAKAMAPKLANGASPEPGLVASKDPKLSEAFSDDFQRPELGDAWRLTSPRWRIEGGQLCGSNARNHPAWLARRLPDNARIEFDATTASSDGDIKVELWGDGRSAATSTSYTDASSYLAIWGGWKNRFHVLARIDEHAKDRLELKIDSESSDPKLAPVVAHRAYHFKIERQDAKTLRWYVDDIEIFSFADPKPLKGSGHDHFGFNNWQVRLCFDNLKVVPLPS